MQRRGKTFIVSGPSGVGKSTVLKALFDQRTDLYFSISATTRDPRPGEVDGVHYHFIPAEEFHRMVGGEVCGGREGGWVFLCPPKITWTVPWTTDGTSFWTSRSKAPTRSAPSDRRRCEFSSHPLHGWSWSGGSPPVVPTVREVIQSRLLRAKVELQTASSYDYLVINDTVEQAVAEMAAILCAEHCRPAERLEQLLHK